MKSSTLLTKIECLPDHLKEDASQYIDFLLSKKKKIKSNKSRKAGFLKGKIEMSNDFDDPLDDFEEYMK
jgi:hypothetical protein